MNVLLELAERCERVSGPDRELDFAIYERALGRELVMLGRFPVWRWQGAQIPATQDSVPPYTASLDAAMALAGDDLSFWYLLMEAAKRCAMATETAPEARFRSRLPAFVSAAVLRALASGTPTRRAETTGSVGEADGGPVAKPDAQPSSDAQGPTP
jgi:hypothetical protein